MKVCVVTRQLKNSRPVPSAVITIPNLGRDWYDNEDVYFAKKAKEHIEQFKKQFVEFASYAEFYIDIIDSI